MHEARQERNPAFSLEYWHGHVLGEPHVDVLPTRHVSSANRQEAFQSLVGTLQRYGKVPETSREVYTAPEDIFNAEDYRPGTIIMFQRETLSPHRQDPDTDEAYFRKFQQIHPIEHDTRMLASKILSRQTMFDETGKLRYENTALFGVVTKGRSKNFLVSVPCNEVFMLFSSSHVRSKGIVFQCEEPIIPIDAVKHFQGRRGYDEHLSRVSKVEVLAFGMPSVRKKAPKRLGDVSLRLIAAV